MNTERKWFKEETDLYTAINQAKEAVWNARMKAVELHQKANEYYQSPAYEAYNTLQCAYELLDTAKLLVMIHFNENKGG